MPKNLLLEEKNSFASKFESTQNNNLTLINELRDEINALKNENTQTSNSNSINSDSGCGSIGIFTNGHELIRQKGRR